MDKLDGGDSERDHLSPPMRADDKHKASFDRNPVLRLHGDLCALLLWPDVYVEEARNKDAGTTDV